MRSAFLAAAAALACSGRATPPAVTNVDVQIALEDIQFTRADVIDGGSPVDDVAAVDVLLGEGIAQPDTPTGSDAAAADDAPRDVVVDAPPAVNRLCNFEESQINAVAVKLATCFDLPPQRVVERLWRPEAWEGGEVYTARVCDVFRLCVALAATRGCPAVLNTCLKIGRAPAGTGTCDGFTTSCDGVRLRTCASGVVTSDSCQAGMRECVATAGQGACVQPNSAPCAAGAPPRCEGATLQRCVAGRYVSVLDCGRTGATCDAAGDRCAGGGEACTGEGATCDGSVIVRCRGGRRHRIDCGLNVRGATCRMMGGDAFCGVALDCDPARAPGTGTCEGTSLAVCAGGRTYRFDCAGQGFGACTDRGCVP